MTKKNLLKITAVMLLTAGIIACGGDNGTNSTEGEPPSIPDLEYSQPDVSYFQNTGNKNKTTSNNYLAAQSTVLGFSTFSSLGQIYQGFIESAPQNEASFNDGIWEWSYSYSYGGASSEMRLTAKETGNSISWALFWSFNDGQGMSVDDYKLMEGTTENDGLTGEWIFNSLDPDTNTPVPVLRTNWVTDGESVSTIEISLFEEGSSNESVSINFDQNGNEFLLAINYAGASEDNIEIFWNPEAEIGYIQEGSGERKCWDSSSASVEDVSCSEVGL